MSYNIYFRWVSVLEGVYLQKLSEKKRVWRGLITVSPHQNQTDTQQEYLKAI